MKAQLYDLKGSPLSQIDLPSWVSNNIREDIIQKCLEVENYQARQWYSPFSGAGRRHSASGTISHRRHKWKGHYGKGIARVPRKKMWRRGTQFFWIGAEVSGTRGGRSVHAPSQIRSPLKMNKKEYSIALKNALSTIFINKFILRRYSSLQESDIPKMPVVIETAPKKTKDFIELIKKVLGNSYKVALKQKAVRSGKGKRRGRTFKSNAGLALIKGDKEEIKIKGIQLISAKDISLKDFFPLGRLTIFTRTGLEELNSI